MKVQRNLPKSVLIRPFFCSSRCHQRLVLHDFIFSFLLKEIIRMSTRAWLLALAKNLYIISYSPLECGHLVG